MRSSIGIGFLLMVASCAQPTGTPTPGPTKAVPSAAPTGSAPSPTWEPTLTAAPDHVEEKCSGTSGRIVKSELRNADLARSLPYRVFIPPCAADLQGELPVLYLLHGLARTDAQWDELGADQTAQRLIAAGRAPPFLIVMPWERLGLDFEQAIVDYLIPHIEQQYGASPDRSLRSIGGISRGAGWAIRIGLKHPELFQAIGLHSPAVLVPDLYALPDWLQAIPAGEAPAIWIDIGDHDPLRFSLPELTDLLDASSLPYLLHSYRGEHIEAYWAEHVEDYLEWYVSGWVDSENDLQPR